MMPERVERIRPLGPAQIRLQDCALCLKTGALRRRALTSDSYGFAHYAHLLTNSALIRFAVLQRASGRFFHTHGQPE